MNYKDVKVVFYPRSFFCGLRDSFKPKFAFRQ
jgi:hypothetical protein